MEESKGDDSVYPSSELPLPGVWLLSPAWGYLEVLRDYLVAFFCGLLEFSVALAFLTEPPVLGCHAPIFLPLLVPDAGLQMGGVGGCSLITMQPQGWAR